jgi:predicted PurR-regulated permease PerM
VTDLPGVDQAPELPVESGSRSDTTAAAREGRQLAALLTRIGIAAWSVVGVLVALWAVLQIMGRVQVLLAPVVLAIALIYVLNPIVNRLHGWRLHRLIGTLVGFILLSGFIVAIGFLVAPSISDQAADLGDNFPEIYEDSVSQIEDLIADIGFGEVDLWSYERVDEFLSDPDNQDQIISAALDNLGAITSGLLEAILVFLVAPVVAFYVLIDLPRIRDESVELVPPRHRNEVIHVSRQLGTAVGGFLRGQVLVAVIVGVLTSVGFWMIGLKFWLIIGMIAGFLNIIPFVGPWVGGGLGVIVGLVVNADVTTAFFAAIVAFAVQQIDNNFVSPAVLRATVRLHPAVVVLVLILGGAIGGLWGVLLAVPVAASIKIVIGHLWRTRVLGQSWDEASEALIEPATPRIRFRDLTQEPDVVEERLKTPEDELDFEPVDHDADDVGEPE